MEEEVEVRPLTLQLEALEAVLSVLMVPAQYLQVPAVAVAYKPWAVQEDHHGALDNQELPVL